MAPNPAPPLQTGNNDGRLIFQEKALMVITRPGSFIQIFQGIKSIPSPENSRR